MKFYTSPTTANKMDFDYDPLEYVEKHFSVCFKDRNLKIMLDENNPLERCFSEYVIFYTLDGKEMPLKLGSNNIMQENIGNKIKFNIKTDKQTKQFEKNITEICWKSPVKKEKIIGMGGGFIVLMGLTVFGFVLFRKKKVNETVSDAMSMKDIEDKAEENHYGNEEYIYYDSIEKNETVSDAMKMKDIEDETEEDYYGNEEYIYYDSI